MQKCSKFKKEPSINQTTILSSQVDNGAGMWERNQYSSFAEELEKAHQQSH